MNFYTNHFSLIISYHSVWLGFEPLGSLSPGALSDGAVLCPSAKDTTITICPICHNKTPDRKLGWSVDDVMPRGDGLENLRILERQLLGIWLLKGQLRIRLLRRVVEFFGSQPAEMTRDLKHHKMRCALGWGSA